MSDGQCHLGARSQAKVIGDVLFQVQNHAAGQTQGLQGATGIAGRTLRPRPGGLDPVSGTGAQAGADLLDAQPQTAEASTERTAHVEKAQVQARPSVDRDRIGQVLW